MALPPPVRATPLTGTDQNPFAPARRPAPAWREPVTVAVAAVVGTGVITAVDPTSTHVPLCPLKAVTGLDCPFCGSLRAVYSLTRLDLPTAANHNIVFTAAVPFLIVGWALWLARTLREPDSRPRRYPRATRVALAFLLAFAVLRNLPALSWLDSAA